jgi:hypothetical protein
MSAGLGHYLMICNTKQPICKILGINFLEHILNDTKCAVKDVALKKAQTLSNCHSKTLGFTMANHFVKNHETQSCGRFWKQTLPLHIK